MTTVQDQPSVGIGSQIPLLFTYKDAIFGNGFVVEVQATNGRALCVREADAFWMYGVNPGGMSASGADATEAHAAFRKTFSNILIDIANDSDSFEEFKAATTAFFEETNVGYEPDWHEAVKAVRANQVQVVGLPVIPATSPRSISIEIKRTFAAADNKTQFESQIAA
jgi:hypothetical protein